MYEWCQVSKYYLNTDVANRLNVGFDQLKLSGLMVPHEFGDHEWSIHLLDHMKSL